MSERCGSGGGGARAWTGSRLSPPKKDKHQDINTHNIKQASPVPPKDEKEREEKKAEKEKGREKEKEKAKEKEKEKDCIITMVTANNCIMTISIIVAVVVTILEKDLGLGWRLGKLRYVRVEARLLPRGVERGRVGD